jgi:A/G-specific adenine glycosylase
MPKEIMSSIEIKNFTKKLISWQRSQGRHHLPWQINRTAYRVWLSEVMLQQTQVATVIERYQAFLKRFPTVNDLAAANIDEVLAEWSGMGYYTRARNLHRCAQEVVSQFDGIFPSNPKLLESLPGIGRSTAAAIAVFAYGESAAILDGNVKRVLARLWGIQDDLSKTVAVKSLWAHAESLLPKTSDDLVSYTQGLMDFGATLCTQNKPACVDGSGVICPFEKDCQAKRLSLINKIPLKVKKVKVTSVDMDWWVVVHQGKILLEKRPHQGIWAGLWSFPEKLALPPSAKKIELPSIKHVLTHRRLNIRPIQVLASKKLSNFDQKLEWIDFSDLKNLGLPTPVKSFLKNSNLIRDDV